MIKSFSIPIELYTYCDYLLISNRRIHSKTCLEKLNIKENISHNIIYSLYVSGFKLSISITKYMNIKLIAITHN